MMDLEKTVAQVAEKAISEAILKELTGYNRPLSNIVNDVISDNSDRLYGLINNEFSALLDSSGFKSSLKDALNSKLAKTLVSRMGGELEKQVNELKTNPTTRAQITLAIEKVIKDV